jgi:hypothetical protein
MGSATRLRLFKGPLYWFLSGVPEALSLFDAGTIKAWTKEDGVFPLGLSNLDCAGVSYRRSRGRNLRASLPLAAGPGKGSRLQSPLRITLAMRDPPISSLRLGIALRGEAGTLPLKRIDCQSDTAMSTS